MDSHYHQTNPDSNRYNWKLFVILCYAKNLTERCIKLFLYVGFGFG